MKNKLFILIGSILFVFCFIVLFKSLKKKNIYTPELKLEKDLPIFVSNDIFSEEQVSSEDIFKNDNYYVINIWASWCIPCKEEHSFY